MTTVDLPLLLGRGKDLFAERGVEFPGDLPAVSDPDLVDRAHAAKARLGDKVFVLGHHYQHDDVIQFADGHRRPVQARPRRRRAARRRVHRLLRSALHGGVRRHPDLPAAEGRAPRSRRRRTCTGSSLDDCRQLLETETMLSASVLLAGIDVRINLRTHALEVEDKYSAEQEALTDAPGILDTAPGNRLRVD